MTLTIDFADHLQEQLKDEEFALEYLTVALEDYEEDKHIEAFLSALYDVAKAQGGLSKLARKTKLNRSNLYEQLSRTGNPALKTIDTILHQFGFRIAVQRCNSDRPSSIS